MTPDLTKMASTFGTLLDQLGLNQADPNLSGTPDRLAKMFVKEVFRGLYEKKPTITAFPSESSRGKLLFTNRIEVKSMCAHHFMPIRGYAWIGLVLGDNMMGLSKFDRLVDWCARRPTVQEHLTTHVLDCIVDAGKPQFAAVAIDAEHMCMTHRGVNSHGGTTTTWDYYEAEPSHDRLLPGFVKGRSGLLFPEFYRQFNAHVMAQINK